MEVLCDGEYCFDRGETGSYENVNSDSAAIKRFRLLGWKMGKVFTYCPNCKEKLKQVVGN